MPKPISRGPLADEREVFFDPAAPAGAPPMTRRQRRAKRQRGHLSAKDGRIAARLARLDYKIPGESGALQVPSRVRTWHLRNRANGHRPPAGRAWDRAGPVRVLTRGNGPAADSTIE